jgi:Holliday junction DNA helicase RuvB
MNFPTLQSNICSKCGGIYYSEGETNEKEACPLCLSCAFPKEEKGNIQEITIVPSLLDTSKLAERKEKVLWRPDNFESYIGQASLKDILQSYMRGCKDLKRTFPHFLVDGKPGSGKTTISYILAKQLGLNFKESLASTIKSPQQLIDLLVEVDGGILLIDELQGINKGVATMLLPIMEDFQISGKHIKPFTLSSCTTEKGILLKKWKPMVDRFKIQKTLDPYSIEELSILLKQYKNKTFLNTVMDDNIFVVIAKNSRGTPRVGIRLLESFIYMNKPLEQVFKAYNIVQDGITTEDIKVLKLLNDSPKGLGLNTICAFLQTSIENFMYQQENYLIELGLMTIGNRRTITLKGKELLNDLSTSTKM